MKALVFGEVLWDVYPDDSYIGGAPFNFAAHFKKCGGESAIVTAVGNDDLGAKTIKEITKMGVDAKFVSTFEKETGKCIVTLNENRIPTYNLLNSVAYDFIQKPLVTANEFDVLYFGTLSLRNEHNRKTIADIIAENTFEHIFADMNIRAPYYFEETVKFVLSNATILKISDEELPVVMYFLGNEHASLKDSIKTLQSTFCNIQLLIITKGGEGSVCYDSKENKMYECEAAKADVVSTVGAGDSFSASFLSRYLMGAPILECMRFAAKVSGYVVSQPGAVPNYNAQEFV